MALVTKGESVFLALARFAFILDQVALQSLQSNLLICFSIFKNPGDFTVGLSPARPAIAKPDSLLMFLENRGSVERLMRGEASPSSPATQLLREGY